MGEKKKTWHDVILHGLAERNASCQRIAVLGFKGKQEDLFVNVVTEEHALRVSVIYPQYPAGNQTFHCLDGTLVNFSCLPYFSGQKLQPFFHPDPWPSHINCKIYHQGPQYERFKLHTFMESPIWGTKMQQPFQTRKAPKWEPPQLAALQKTRQSVY